MNEQCIELGPTYGVHIQCIQFPVFVDPLTTKDLFVDTLTTKDLFVDTLTTKDQQHF